MFIILYSLFSVIVGGIWNAFMNAIKVSQDAEEGDEKVIKLESTFSTLGL
jgi:hypothetical protein